MGIVFAAVILGLLGLFVTSMYLLAQVRANPTRRGPKVHLVVNGAFAAFGIVALLVGAISELR